MTVPYRKKLIEVALPLKAINEASADEKAVPRRGHPQAIHLWWARRPLAACRAVLFSSMVDDPDSDPQFLKTDGSVDEDTAGVKRADLFNLIEELVMWENSNNPDVIRSARAEIARCVASRKIETGALKKDTTIGANTTVNDLVKRGHCRPIPLGLDTKVGRVRFSFDVSRLPPADVIDSFLSEHAPPILDPFAGGGSIPLEAQRLGLRAIASDLNPVPVLINKALIEIPARFAGRSPINPGSRGQGIMTQGGKGKKSQSLIERDWPGATGLADDVRFYGQWMRDEAVRRIGHLYPRIKVTKELAGDRPDLLPLIGEELIVVAWLWARSVATPSPVYNGAQVPLISSYWLSTKAGKQAWIEPIIDKTNQRYRFAVRVGTPTDAEKLTIDAGTKIGRGCKFKCLLSNEPIPDTHVKQEGMAGRLRARMLAIVAEGPKGRVYLPPTEEQDRLATNLDMSMDLTGIDVPIALDKRAIWCLLYGLTSFDQLFTSRQLAALTTLSDLARDVRSLVKDHMRTAAESKNGSYIEADANSYADAIATYMALAISKLADWSSTLCGFIPSYGKFGHTFGRQGIPMVWDFAELNVFGEAVGNWTNHVEWVSRAVEHVPAGVVAMVSNLDATSSLSVNGDKVVVSTDPPYYDNIGYADLSDYFYVWLRRSLKGVYPSLFATALTPKAQELIASPYRHDGDKAKSQEFFEDGLGQAFSRMHEVQIHDCPLTVYYAFKQSETDEGEDSSDGAGATQIASTGWETMLAGLIHSGFSISGTWPMRTERTARSIGIGTNALASSIVLVCRPRPTNASLATRKEFITALRRELPEALRNLQRGNIAPVDLAQAAIGPGMAVFTRYAKVIESDGSAMTIRTALGIINQSLDEVLAEQEGEFDSDTRWALAWFEQFGMAEGPFGDAETLSKAKNTAVNGLVEAGIIVAHAGKVRLVKREELPADWNPATDKRLTAWEVTQHLIHRLDQQGELGASALVNQLGSVAEISRDLAYRLYSTCERKKWAQDALAYNSLVVAWPELRKLALSSRNRQTSTQQELFN